jgi:hypothetical protein
MDAAEAAEAAAQLSSVALVGNICDTLNPGTEEKYEQMNLQPSSTIFQYKQATSK